MRIPRKLYGAPAASENGDLGRDDLAYRRRRRNPWGAKVDELLGRKTMTLRQLGERVKDMGYGRMKSGKPLEHPYKSINRFQQPEHWKVDHWLLMCVADALELDEDEVDEYWRAVAENGRFAKRMGFI